MAVSIIWRNGTITAFANAGLPGTSKFVELRGVEVKEGYKLDFGPEGEEMTPGYELAKKRVALLVFYTGYSIAIE
jgi:hypothetical protein